MHIAFTWRHNKRLTESALRPLDTGRSGGSAEPQRAFQDHGRRLADGKAVGGDLFGGGANKPDDSYGEPVCGQSLLEVAGALASPYELLEPGGAGLVRRRVAGLRALAEGGGE
jgi:hypothetical protein